MKAATLELAFAEGIWDSEKQRRELQGRLRARRQQKSSKVGPMPPPQTAARGLGDSEHRDPAAAWFWRQCERLDPSRASQGFRGNH